MADSKKPLRRLKKKQNQTLDKYSETIRSDLSKLDRLKFKAVIVIEIHARDVIEKMYKMSKLIRVFFCNYSFILDTTLVLVTYIFVLQNTLNIYSDVQPTNYRSFYRTASDATASRSSVILLAIRYGTVGKRRCIR